VSAPGRVDEYVCAWGEGGREGGLGGREAGSLDELTRGRMGEREGERMLG
jgi:hypothetical protein